jgi:hypothetical protein
MPEPITALQEFLIELDREAARTIGKAPMLGVEKEVGDLDDMFERLMNG